MSTPGPTHVQLTLSAYVNRPIGNQANNMWLIIWPNANTDSNCDTVPLITLFKIWKKKIVYNQSQHIENYTITQEMSPMNKTSFFCATYMYSDRREHYSQTLSGKKL